MVKLTSILPLLLLPLWSLTLTKRVHAVVVVEDNEPECIKSLNTIYEAEKRIRDDHVHRLYVLCPDTEFFVALNFAEDGKPLDGQYPIPAGRPNMEVRCGQDGKSENNCQLVRGLVHVGIVDEFKTNSKAENVILQGLTFFRATSVNVIAMIGGDITIKDCIFKRNRNVASIYAVAPRTGASRRLSLAGNSSNDRKSIYNLLSQNSKHRALQTNNTNTPSESGQEDTADLRIKIVNCVFSDNVLGASPGADSTAIIYSVGAFIDMSHSVIVGTTKNVQAKETVPNLIYVDSANLDLNSNCFIGNSDDITPVVISQQSSQTAMVKRRLNFNQRTTSFLSNTNCEFMAYTQQNATTFLCEPSDGEVCVAKGTSDYGYPCITYLDDIYFSEWDVTDDSIPRSYILCPQTTFRVGSRHTEDGTPQGGSYPIILGRSNIRVLCGANGKIENDCNVVNGIVQVALFDEFQTGGQPIENALVQGISFSKATAMNALISGSGDVVLRDCIFHENSNVANVYSQRLVPEGRGRKMLASILPELAAGSSRNLLKTWRRVQQVANVSLTTQIDSCVFSNNTISSAANPVSGLITNDNATMVILNSMIVDTINAASTDNLGYFEVGYLIRNMDGEMRLAKNCFYDNEVTIAPVVNRGSLQAMFNTGRQAMTSAGILSPELTSESVGRSSNYAEESALSAADFDAPNVSVNATEIDSTNPPIDHVYARCEFVATIHGLDDVLSSINPELVEFECEEFDTESCHREDAPTSAPTMAPTTHLAPTYAPTHFPTPITEQDEPTEQDERNSSASRRLQSVQLTVVAAMLGMLFV